jgi:uncharacterized membrane-anchored protein
MEERTRAQLHIEQAVEGFSVIAITYYGIGLAKVFVKALPEVGIQTRFDHLALLALTPSS